MNLVSRIPIKPVLIRRTDDLLATERKCEVGNLNQQSPLNSDLFSNFEREIVTIVSLDLRG